MANEQYTIDNSDRTDGTVFTVPGDEDGGAGDQSFQLERNNLDERQHVYVHIENGFDVSADVTLRGSRYDDRAMTVPVEDGAAETVASGEQGAFDSDVAHSFVEVSVDPASTPTSGQLVITFQGRRA